MKQHATTKGDGSPIYQIMGDQNIHLHLDGASLRVRDKENLDQALNLLQESSSVNADQSISLPVPNQSAMKDNSAAVNDFLLGKITTLHNQIASMEKANSELLDVEYQKIRHAEINSDKQTAWELLQPIVDDAEKQANCQYSRYFFFAAQLIMDQDAILSEKYYGIEVMSRMKLKAGDDFAFEQGDRHLCLCLNSVYDRYTRYRRDCAIQGEVLGYNQFKKQLERCDFFVEKNRTKRFGEGTKRVWVVDYHKLSGLCDVAGFVRDEAGEHMDQQAVPVT
jgi:hypothetical protein